MSTFSIDQPFLNRILRDIGNGRIQLPDFQRGWVWDDDRIRSLIASVSQEFPIGSVLTLKADDTDVRFKARLIEGVNSTDVNREPETLILDGQQRLTALFQTLMSENPVFTKNTQGQKTLRHYYLDMKACLRSSIERENAVISCREDNRFQTSEGNVDLSLPEKQYEYNLFPVHKIFESADWRPNYYRYWDFDKNKIDLYDKFESKIIQSFNRYNVPVIELRGVPREAVCMVFEKVNTGGVTLTVFELLTASFAVDGFQLRKDWNKREKRLKQSPVLKRLDSTSFLRALTLLTTNANSDSKTTSCTRRDILGLKKKDYEKWADHVEHGFAKVARFLHTQKIFNAKDVPYQTQLVPLAAILTDLGKIEEIEGAEEKIARWFWCGVFGEMYAGSTDTRAANDFSEVTKWVKGMGMEEVPTTIRDAKFSSSRLLQLERRTSAAYKGVHALIMHDRTAMKCCDFRTRVPIDEKIFFEDQIDIHHIFPKKWCQNRNPNIESKVFNSIVNKTAIAARTNRKIGGNAPSEYLPRIQNEAGMDSAKMDEILASHLIYADALRTDDFDRFFEARKEALLNAIEKVMGENKVVRDSDDQSDIST